MFAGEMTRSRAEWIADVVAAGLCSGGISKATRVVVAADPDSLSSKAAKARQYGIPIISETAFGRMFDAFQRS